MNFIGNLRYEPLLDFGEYFSFSGTRKDTLQMLLVYCFVKKRSRKSFAVGVCKSRSLAFCNITLSIKKTEQTPRNANGVVLNG